MQYKELITKHLEKYSEMQALDILKLIYQSVLGPGHFSIDESTSLNYLKSELPNSDNNNSNLEYIINYYRVNLNLIKANTLELDTFNKLFCLSQNRELKDEKFISIINDLAEDFPAYDLKGELLKYLENRKPFSHSKVFNNLYSPHYRLIKEELIKFLPVFIKIDNLLKTKKNPIILIDGNCASGKSYLSSIIEKVYDISLIKADDFFLVKEGKSLERLNEIGGNIDYERFALEVSANLNKPSKFSYNKYSCQKGALDGLVDVDNSKIRVIEGSYSKNPKMQITADLNIFLTLEGKTQLERLEKRNPHLVSRFISEWIPKENSYFETLNIAKDFDLIINTSNTISDIN